MKKRVLWLLFAVYVLLSGCSDPGSVNANQSGAPEPRGGEDAAIWADGYSYPLKIRDYIGTEFVLYEKPERVAVISSATLNLWYDMGGKSIATPDVSANVKLDPIYADEIRALPSLGMYYAMSLESLVALDADLYIMQYELRATAMRLREMGFIVLVTGLKSFDDVLDTYVAFGRILGDNERAADRIKKLTGERNAITARLPNEGKTVVILYLTSNTLSAKLNNSIAGDLIQILGLHNICTDLPPDTIGSENTPLDVEYIVEKNPDYVFVSSMVSNNETAEAMIAKYFADNPAWKGVAAITEGRVVFLPQQYFLVNAGPFYGEAIEYMAKCVYPEIFGVLNKNDYK